MKGKMHNKTKMVFHQTSSYKDMSSKKEEKKKVANKMQNTTKHEESKQ